MTSRMLVGLSLALAANAAAAQTRSARDTVLPPAPAARPITLDEAVRLAQRNSPAAVSARGQIRNSQAAIRSSYAAFIPSVSLSSGSTRQAGDRFDPVRDEVFNLPTTWQYGDAVSAGLTLFDGGRRFYDVSAARANATAAEANDVSQRYRVALDVKQQYFNVLAARESESAARTQLEQAQQQLKASSARVAAGAATRSDSLRSVILVGNAQLAMLTARNSLTAANAALTRLVATPFPVTAANDTIGEFATPVDSAAIAREAEQGPAVAQARAQVAAARAASRSARTPYLPTIGATYSRGRTASDDNFRVGGDPLIYSSTLRLSLSYPLFNQWQREEQKVRANVAEDVAEATLRDTRLAAQQQLSQYLGALRTAEARVSIQSASVAAAEEDLRVQQQRYALGASTLLDVLTSQTQLTQARAALIAARYDARVARAQIEALIGRDLR